MKRKKLWGILFASIFLAIVIVILLVRPSALKESTVSSSKQITVEGIENVAKRNTDEQQYLADPWTAWIDAQTEIQTEVLLEEIRKKMPSSFEDAKKQMVDLKAQTRAAFERMAKELQKNADRPPPVKVYDFSELPPPENQKSYGPKKHTGPQTVGAILKTFEGMVASSPELEQKYPQAEWVQMLLGKGIAIGDFADYSGYMWARSHLMRLENTPEEWQSGKLGIPPTDDWQTYRSAYIDRKIWEYQQLKEAHAVDSAVSGGFFTGTDSKTFLPFTPGRVYVRRGRGSAVFNGATLTAKQRFNLLFRGEPPEGYDIVYIDKEGNRLGELPPAISRKEASMPEGWGMVSVNEKVAQDGPLRAPVASSISESISEDISFPANSATESYESYIQHLDSAQHNAFHDATMSDTEIEAKLEHRSLPELALPFAENIESSLYDQFDMDRLEKAIGALERYGIEEGLQRLRTNDPEIADEFERNMYQQRTSDSAEHKSQRDGEPNEHED